MYNLYFIYYTTIILVYVRETKMEMSWGGCQHRNLKDVLSKTFTVGFQSHTELTERSNRALRKYSNF